MFSQFMMHGQKNIKLEYYVRHAWVNTKYITIS